jgi:hypothetical protein
MKQLKNAFAIILLSMLGTLFTIMFLTKPSNANWQSWPTQFIIGLLRTSTAENARKYLGIETGVPLSSTGTGSEMELGADASNFYVSLGNGQWAVVTVDSTVQALLNETGSVLLHETGKYMLAE